MRFLGDMGVSRRVIERLRAAGRDEGPRRHSLGRASTNSPEKNTEAYKFKIVY